MVCNDHIAYKSLRSAIDQTFKSASKIFLFYQ